MPQQPEGFVPDSAVFAGAPEGFVPDSAVFAGAPEGFVPDTGEAEGWGDTLGGLLSGAGDVAIGAGKGLVKSITGGAQLLGPVINRMSAKSFGRKPIDLSVGDDFFKQFDSDNTAQSVGMGLELGAEFLLPTSIPGKIGGMVKAGKATYATAKAGRAAKAAELAPNGKPWFSAVPQQGIEELGARGSEFASTDDISRMLSGQQVAPGAKSADAVSELRRGELMGKLGGQQAATPVSTPLSTAPPLGKASTAAELAIDKAFPLSARTSDASRSMSMPIREGEGAGKALQFTATERTAGGKIKKIRVGDYDIDLSTLPPGKLTGAEVRDLVLGRGRMNARAKGKQLPKNVVGELDRMGLEYRRTTTDIEKLQAIPTANPQELQQLLQGKYELGFRVEQRMRQALTEAAKDESGMVSLPMTIMLGRASAVASAGVLGYAATDDPEDKLTNAILAGYTTGFATYALPAVYKAITGAAGRGHVPATTAEEYMYGSMLSRPATIVRSTTGQLSAAAHGISTRILEGRFDDALAITTDLMHHGPGRYAAALRNGSTTQRLSGATQRRTTGGIMGIPLRLIAASDDAVVPALRKGGFSLEEAQRLTLQGVPESDMGKAVVSVFATNWLGRLLQPFAKVGVHMVEQPLQMFRKDLPGAERVARGIQTAGAAAWGATTDGERDLRYDPYRIATAGPNAIPMALGLAYSWAKENDKNIPSMMLKALDQANPLEASASDTLRGLGGRAIPGAMSDIARMMDPEMRERSGMIDNLKVRIPGKAGGYGRESLPIREAPLDIFGDDLPNQQVPESAFERLFLGDPSPSNLPTRYPHSSPTARMLKDLGINRQAPSADLTAGGEPVDVPSDIARQFKHTKGSIIDDALTMLMEMPIWETLDAQGRREAVKLVLEDNERFTGGDDMRERLGLAVVERLEQQ